MLPARTWQVSLTAAYGTFRTSHIASCPDVAPECSADRDPGPRHHGQLDLTHADLFVAYAPEPISSSRPGSPRPEGSDDPYTTLDGGPYVPPYGDIHHRTETLRGLSDAEFLAGRREGAGPRRGLHGSARKNGTGSDRAGPRAGRSTSTSSSDRHRGSEARGSMVAPCRAPPARGGRRRRFPLYETPTASGLPSPSWAIGPSAALGSAGLARQLAGQYQSIGRWNGEKDEGTGFHNGGACSRLRSGSAKAGVCPRPLSRDLLQEPVGRDVPPGHDLFAGAVPLLPEMKRPAVGRRA